MNFRLKVRKKNKERRVQTEFSYSLDDLTTQVHQFKEICKFAPSFNFVEEDSILQPIIEAYEKKMDLENTGLQESLYELTQIIKIQKYAKLDSIYPSFNSRMLLSTFLINKKAKQVAGI